MPNLYPSFAISLGKKFKRPRPIKWSCNYVHTCSLQIVWINLKPDTFLINHYKISDVDHLQIGFRFGLDKDWG